MIRQVIWDIDGTLLNTQSGVAAAVAYTLAEYGIEEGRERLVEQIVYTPKITQALIDIAGFSADKAKEATDVFRTRYLEHDLYNATPYPGIIKVVESIGAKGIRQAIATNKRQDCAEAICEHFSLTKYCEPIIGADQYNTQTKAALIAKCMQELRSATDETLYIGDMPTDKAAAEELGIRFLGVNYGLGFRLVEGYANEPGDILTVLFQNN